MLGELNWIFTAITDTIAWNTLPRTLFQKLFRQDLLVASLFRNFLLAERVMRSYDCTPVSQPSLPSTHQVKTISEWPMDPPSVLPHTFYLSQLKFNIHCLLFSILCGKLGTLPSIYPYLNYQTY